MVYFIGFIVSLVLWLFTFKNIIESNNTTVIKIVYVVLIIVFPFMGVIYPIYKFGRIYLEHTGKI